MPTAPPPADPPAAGVRSLVVAPQWIGDAVMSEPLLRALARRGEAVTVAALPWVAPAYRAMACVAEVQEWPLQHGRLDLALRWRLGRSLAGRFQRAYVLPNSIKAALVPCFAGVPVRIGYQGEGRPGLLTHRLPNPAGRPAMVGFYRALADGGPPSPGPAAQPPDAATPADDTPRLQLPPGALEALCARLGVAPGRYRVFAPGAEYGPAKCWPAEHYAALGRLLLERDGMPLLLIGSGKEAEVCEAIARTVASSHPQGAAAPCRSLAGQTSLAEAIVLVSGARTLVSNDSGLMHVAAAFGIEQLALFGSTSPLHTPPLNPRAQVLWLKDELGLDCMPCFERRCRFGHLKCLVGITPDRAAAAIASVGAPVPGRTGSDAIDLGSAIDSRPGAPLARADLPAAAAPPPHGTAVPR